MPANKPNCGSHDGLRLGHGSNGCQALSTRAQSLCGDATRDRLDGSM